MHVEHRVQIGRKRGKAIITLARSAASVLRTEYGVLLSHYLLVLGVNIGHVPPKPSTFGKYILLEFLGSFPTFFSSALFYCSKTAV
jgi:hypothetical protein